VALNFILDNYNTIKLSESISDYFLSISLLCQKKDIQMLKYNEIVPGDGEILYKLIDTKGKFRLIRILNADTNMFEMLPSEILIHIISYLNIPSQIYSLSKYILKICKDNEINILRNYLNSKRINCDEVNDIHIKSLVKNIISQRSGIVATYNNNKYFLIEENHNDYLSTIYNNKNIIKFLEYFNCNKKGLILLFRNGTVYYSESLKNIFINNKLISGVKDIAIVNSCIFFMKYNGNVYSVGDIRSSYMKIDLQHVKKLKEIKNCQKIITGYDNVCFLTEEKTVYYSGCNSGLLFGGTPYFTNIPTMIKNLENVIDVVISKYYVLYLKSNGSLEITGLDIFDISTKFTCLTDIIKITGNIHLGYAMAMNSKGKIYIILGNTLTNKPMNIIEDVTNIIELNITNVFQFSIGKSSPSLLLTADNHLYITGYYDYKNKAMDFSPILIKNYHEPRILEYSHILINGKMKEIQYFRQGVKIFEYN